jgi:hypothetical protein
MARPTWSQRFERAAMNSIVHIPAIYRFRSDAEREAEATAATVTKPPPEETPADLDSALAALDLELRKLDELTDKDRNFPAELATIEAKHKTLTDQELDSVEAIQSRSAEMSKISAMRELSVIRQKKLAAAISTQREAVVKIGGQAANLLEKLWWDLHTEAHSQAEIEFNRLFFHAFEAPEVLNKYRPLQWLQWHKPPDVLRTRDLDTQIARARQLRASTDRLRQFERMTFEEISNELEALDRESRQRAQQVRQIGSATG